MIDLNKRGRDVLTVIAIGAFLAFINPYNATGSLSYPLALLYWTSMIAAGGLAAELGMALYNRSLQTPPVWGMLAVGALCSAAAVTGFIVAIEHIFNDGVPLWFWPRLYGLVLVISVAITLIGYTVNRAFDRSPERSGDTRSAIETFLNRLPVKYRTSELHAIASEDHYLRVYTSLGEELILMRLADAERELANADGLRVHRSWWVSRASVREEKRIDGRSLLILPSGVEVPVSRSYRAAAKSAGLIQ